MLDYYGIITMLDYYGIITMLDYYGIIYTMITKISKIDIN